MVKAVDFKCHVHMYVYIRRITTSAYVTTNMLMMKTTQLHMYIRVYICVCVYNMETCLKIAFICTQVHIWFLAIL